MIVTLSLAKKQFHLELQNHFPMVRTHPSCQHLMLISHWTRFHSEQAQYFDRLRISQSMLFLDKLFANCHAFPEKTAIEFRDGDAALNVSYSGLRAAIEQTAAWLHGLGVRRGDRVAACLPKSPAGVYIHLAACRLGAVSMPLNPGYSNSELIYILSDSSAKLLIVDAAKSPDIKSLTRQVETLERMVSVDSASFDKFIGGMDAAAPACEISPDATALMLYTSGTTGRPKAAQLSHSNLTAIVNMLAEAWEWRADDTLLHVLPIFHVHGLLVALHGALHAGAATIAFKKFEPAPTLDALQHSGCTVFMGVPTIHSRLVAAAQPAKLNAARLRLVTSGSARLSEDLFQKISDCFKREPVERYGLTETGILLSNPLTGQRRPGWVGLPLPGVEMRVVDPSAGAPLADGAVGEIQTRGPHVFKGYWNAPEKTAAAFSPDGWFKTGDLGLRDSQGYFQLRGRSSELVISGGMNVYPLEVERVLDSHPAVVQSAVIGCPDVEWGESVTAVLVVSAADAVSQEELVAYCRRHLASYKLPKRILFVETLPRNAMGKVSKPLLRESHCGDGR